MRYLPPSFSTVVSKTEAILPRTVVSESDTAPLRRLKSEGAPFEPLDQEAVDHQLPAGPDVDHGPGALGM